MNRFAKAAAPLAIVLSITACATVPTETQLPVTLRVVGLNDFHGNLEPIRRPTTLKGADGTDRQVQVAGVAHLASAVAGIRAQAEHSLVIAAGDLIGGSPLVSSYFLDEPAIGAMNRLGLDFNAVGNHEFDRGWRELKRMQDGGCEKLALREPCAVESDFPGARFKFLAANVVTSSGETLFPAYAIKSFGEGKRSFDVGVIGLTLKETPTLVTPSGVDGLAFGDEALAINRAVDALSAKGVKTIVVAIHQGLYTDVGYNDKSCGGVSGALLDILKGVDSRVDLVISGHTHRAYVCDFAAIDAERPFLVTSAGYGGSFLTDIRLAIDPKSGDVIARAADNVVVQVGGEGASPVADFRAFAPEPGVAQYVARYVAAAADASARPVGKISGEARDPGPATEETALGNLIADAQLFGTRSAGAQIAFMNNSGIRTGMTPAADGTVTYGDIYAVQPFGNTLVTKTFTGAQLLALLEQQFDAEGVVQTFSPSAGFAMTYDMRRPAGSRVISATLDGAPIDPAKSYRVTMNSFLAAGGDSFTVFNQGTDATIGAVDLDAMEEYLRAVPLRRLPALGRVTAIGG